MPERKRTPVRGNSDAATPSAKARAGPQAGELSDVDPQESEEMPEEEPFSMAELSYGKEYRQKDKENGTNL